MDQRVATAAGDYFLPILCSLLCTLQFTKIDDFACQYFVYRYWYLYFQSAWTDLSQIRPAATGERQPASYAVVLL